MSPLGSPSTGTCRAAAGSRDEGSASLFVLIAVVALMLAIGLVVDGGRKIEALQRADALAQEAARTASQQLIAHRSVRGLSPQIDTATAQQAAGAYLAAAGVQGTATANATTVTVTATVTEPTTFLAAIGIADVSATATATARIVRGLDQEVP